MIIRWWRAVAGSEDVLKRYADHLERTTFVEMAELPGHLGAALAVKVKGEDYELVVTSLWADLGSAGHFEKGDFDEALDRARSLGRLPDEKENAAKLIKQIMRQMNEPK